MKLALDLDGTISAHPEFFRFMACAWFLAGGEVYFITARKPSDRAVTVQHLTQWGFAESVPGAELHARLHMYPHEYTWPYQNGVAALWYRQKHAEWKAEICRRLAIDAIFDDDEHNIRACQKSDTRCFHVTKHGAKQA